MREQQYKWERASFSLSNILFCARKIMIVSLITTSACYGVNALDFAKRTETFFDNRHYDEATEYYTGTLEERERSLNNFAIAYYNLGNAYAADHQYDRAIENYNKATELNPRYAEAYNNRGVAYESKQEYNRAIEDFNKAIELSPRDAQPPTIVGSLMVISYNMTKPLRTSRGP
jgi:tetratricopeptide (TPR) repeat protein